MHCCWLLKPTSGAIDPAAQGYSFALGVPGGQKNPSGHRFEPRYGFTVPIGQKYPAGQIMQCSGVVEPETLLNVPAGQGTKRPGVEQYPPLGQMLLMGRRSVEGGLQRYPASQMEQLADEPGE